MKVGPAATCQGEQCDSFAVSIQGAMTVWGRRASYDCVAAMCGTAFCPPLLTNEPCAGRWTDYDSDARVEFLGHAFGFVVERCPPEGAARKFDCFARHARRALLRNDVVLDGSNWHWVRVVEWPEETREVQVTGPNGSEQRRAIGPGSRAYVLHPVEHSISRAEALREGIRFGAKVAAGEYQGGQAAYGGRIYDAWLERLHGPQFCGACADKGWRCAEKTGARVRAGHLSAARFLERASAFLGHLPCGESLREASRSYAQMAAALVPYSVGCDLHGILSEPARRRRYAEDIGRVRSLHQAAAGHLVGAACVL